MNAHDLGVEPIAAVIGPGEVAEERSKEHPHRLFEAQCRVIEAAKGVGHLLDRPQQNGAIQAFLVAEVVVDRCHVDAGGVADLARRCGYIALGREDPGRGGDQLLAREDTAIGRALGGCVVGAERTGLVKRAGFEGNRGGGIHRAAQCITSIKRLIET